jgi:hypothetical protein
MRDSFPHPDTPAKQKTAADGYQVKAIRGLPLTPAERNERKATNRGAEDITSSPVRGDMTYD